MSSKRTKQTGCGAVSTDKGCVVRKWLCLQNFASLKCRHAPRHETRAAFLWTLFVAQYKTLKVPLVNYKISKRRDTKVGFRMCVKTTAVLRVNKLLESELGRNGCFFQRWRNWMMSRWAGKSATQSEPLAQARKSGHSSRQIWALPDFGASLRNRGLEPSFVSQWNDATVQRDFTNEICLGYCTCEFLNSDEKKECKCNDRLVMMSSVQLSKIRRTRRSDGEIGNEE